jgi:hypothetical protein
MKKSATGIELHVPSFFLETSNEALIDQVRWLRKTAGISGDFFVDLLKMNEEHITAWMQRKKPLSPHNRETLQSLWKLMLHLLSLFDYDVERVTKALEIVAKADSELGKRPAPPWLGLSIRAYIAKRGRPAIEETCRWVEGLRFADS